MLLSICNHHSLLPLIGSSIIPSLSLVNEISTAVPTEALICYFYYKNLCNLFVNRPPPLLSLIRITQIALIIIIDDKANFDDNREFVNSFELSMKFLDIERVRF